MSHVDFKITTWERVTINDDQKDMVLAKLKSGEISSANDMVNDEIGHYEGKLDDVDEQMNPEENGGCSTIEFIEGELGNKTTIWENGQVVDPVPDLKIPTLRKRRKDEDWCAPDNELWEKIEAINDKAKSKGEIVGRIITHPYADGKAIYMVVNKNYLKAKIKVVEIWDAWVLPAWGEERWLPLKEVIDMIRGADEFAAFLERSKKK